MKQWAKDQGYTSVRKPTAKNPSVQESIFPPEFLSVVARAPARRGRSNVFYIEQVFIDQLKQDRQYTRFRDEVKTKGYTSVKLASAQHPQTEFDWSIFDRPRVAPAPRVRAAPSRPRANSKPYFITPHVDNLLRKAKKIRAFTMSIKEKGYTKLVVSDERNEEDIPLPIMGAPQAPKKRVTYKTAEGVTITKFVEEEKGVRIPPNPIAVSIPAPAPRLPLIPKNRAFKEAPMTKQAPYSDEEKRQILVKYVLKNRSFETAQNESVKLLIEHMENTIGVRASAVGGKWTTFFKWCDNNGLRIPLDSNEFQQYLSAFNGYSDISTLARYQVDTWSAVNYKLNPKWSMLMRIDEINR